MSASGKIFISEAQKAAEASAQQDVVKYFKKYILPKYLSHLVLDEDLKPLSECFINALIETYGEAKGREKWQEVLLRFLEKSCVRENVLESEEVKLRNYQHDDTHIHRGWMKMRTEPKKNYIMCAEGGFPFLRMPNLDSAAQLRNLAIDLKNVGFQPVHADALVYATTSGRRFLGFPGSLEKGERKWYFAIPSSADLLAAQGKAATIPEVKLEKPTNLVTASQSQDLEKKATPSVKEHKMSEEAEAQKEVVDYIFKEIICKPSYFESMMLSGAKGNEISMLSDVCLEVAGQDIRDRGRRDFFRKTYIHENVLSSTEMERRVFTPVDTETSWSCGYGRDSMYQCHEGGLPFIVVGKIKDRETLRAIRDDLVELGFQPIDPERLDQTIEPPARRARFGSMQPKYALSDLVFARDFYFEMPSSAALLKARDKVRAKTHRPVSVSVSAEPVLAPIAVETRVSEAKDEHRLQEQKEKCIEIYKEYLQLKGFGHLYESVGYPNSKIVTDVVGSNPYLLEASSSQEDWPCMRCPPALTEQMQALIDGKEGLQLLMPKFINRAALLVVSKNTSLEYLIEQLTLKVIEEKVKALQAGAEHREDTRVVRSFV